jgi:hypothetical protein
MKKVFNWLIIVVLGIGLGIAISNLTRDETATTSDNQPVPREVVARATAKEKPGQSTTGCIEEIATRLAIKDPDAKIKVVLNSLRKGVEAQQIKPLIAEAQRACNWAKFSVGKTEACNGSPSEALAYRNKLSEYYATIEKSLDSLYGYFDTQDGFHMNKYKEYTVKAQKIKIEVQEALDMVIGK